MSLYQRGDIWWAKLYQDGLPIYKTTKTSDKQEAKRLHDAWAGEIAKGAFLPKADQVKYDELVADLKRHYENTESRNMVEARSGSSTSTRSSAAPAPPIDAAVAAAYVEQRRKADAANGTINRELGILTRVSGSAARTAAPAPASDPQAQGSRAPPGVLRARAFDAVRRIYPTI